MPFYRLEGFQAWVGEPVADATQWDPAERVAACAYPVVEQLKYLAAQGEVIDQADTPTRVLAVIKENRKTSGQAEPRTGMYPTGLVATADDRSVFCRADPGGGEPGGGLSRGECRRVLDDLDLVFKHEATARPLGLTAAERLAYHQAHWG